MARIILTGDERIAGRYLSWARVRLSRIKRGIERTGRRCVIASPLFPEDGVEVHISSAFGHDVIRIIASRGTAFYVVGIVHELPAIWGAQIDPTTRWRIESRSFQDGHILTQIDFGTPLEIAPTYFAGTTPIIRDKFIYIVDSTPLGSWASGYPAKWRIQQRTLLGSLIWEQLLPIFEGIITGVESSKSFLFITGDTQQNTHLDPINGRIECRDVQDGTLVWEIALPAIFPNCIAYDVTDEQGMNYLYTGEHYFDPSFFGINTWRVRKYDAATGGAVWYQDYNGGHGASPGTIKVDKDGLYIGGIKNGLYEGKYARVERRDKKTGALLWEFIDPLYTDSFGSSVSSVTSLVLTQKSVIVSSRVDYEGIWFTSEIRALDKITGAVLWYVQIGIPGITQNATLEAASFLDPNDGNIIMGCETVDGHYLFKKRSLSDGAIIWEVNPSTIFGDV
jgi:PQQ-like domain